jgi:hypothetical protein
MRRHGALRHTDALSKRHTTLDRHYRANFGLNSAGSPGGADFRMDDLVGLVSRPNKIVAERAAPAERILPDEPWSICFYHQFNVIIVFNFYVWMSDKR